MKILITGGAGFIGSHTAVALHDAGHTPVIVDNFSNAEPWIIDRIADITGKRPVLYDGDCTDRAFMDRVLTTEKSISGVIHFAGSKAVGESLHIPLTYYRNNLFSLLTVIDAMLAHDVRTIIFSSSATVYGDPDVNPIAEDTPRKPATNPYGNTKAIAEDILHDTVASGAPLVAIALRYFNPIGAHASHRIGELPRGVPNNLVPYITQAAAGIRDHLTVFGDDYDTSDGTGVRDFIHVSDLADAHVATLTFFATHTGPLYDIFNVGTGSGTSVRTLIDTFERVNSVAVPHTIGVRRDGDIAACWADATKITDTIGWHATRTVADALRDAWAWQTSLSKDIKIAQTTAHKT